MLIWAFLFILTIPIWSKAHLLVSFFKTILLFASFLLLFNPLNAQDKQRVDQLNFTAIGLLKSNPDSVRLLVGQSESLAEELNYIWGLGTCEAVLGKLAINEGDLIKGYKHYTHALDLYQQSDSLEYYNLFNAYNNVAYILAKYHDYDKAIPYYDSAIHALKSVPDDYPEFYLQQKDRWLIDLPYYKARHLKDAGRLTESGKILIDLWENSHRQRDTVRLTKVLNQIGIVKKRLGEYDEAQRYYGIIASGKDVRLSTRAIANHNLGSVYLAEGNLDRAEYFYKIAQEQKAEVGKARSQFITLLDLGEVQYKKEDYQAAINYWNTALATYSDIDNSPSLYVIYDWLERAYKRIDLEKSDEYGVLYADVNEKYLARQSALRTEETKNSFNNMIDQKRDEMERQARIDQIIQHYWPLCFPIAFLLILAVYLIRKQLLLKKQYRKIESGANDLFDVLKDQT